MQNIYAYTFTFDKKGRLSLIYIYIDEIPVFPILDMHVRNKKS